MQSDALENSAELGAPKLPDKKALPAFYLQTAFLISS